MQTLIALCAILAVSNAEVPRFGEDKCTWGPSYWCENIKNAAECNTTKHCIKAVWIDMEVPEDNDNVCNICKDMVQQARDQLQSNQTQHDLRAVFEGSCKLIEIQPIVEECIKLVDQFIPDLVETLASQMNPSVVCSVAGLCNSAHIDKLLEESTIKVDEMKTRSLEDDELEPDECTKCYTVAAHMESKLNNTSRDKMLQQMLNMCTELGTFTDACAVTILTYFDTIYAHLQENFNTQNICHLSGQCSSKFHKHDEADETPKVDIRPLSSVGMVDVSDDLPCKLCEQLVGHLRDILVANTTETEFRQVLNGLCKQTKSFATECTAVVDEYYPEIYEYLTRRLNNNFVCQMSGICPVSDKTMQDAPIWPLLPKNVAEIGLHIFHNSKKKLENEKHEELSKTEVEAMQLPIERMVPFPISEGPLDVKGTEQCALCEYALHYIQEKLTYPATEDKVKSLIKTLCEKLPGSISGECMEFTDTYGDAIVAILAQEIDPSQVCPMLHLCPTERLMKLWESVPAKYLLEEQQNKPSCPLCLLAITQIHDVIRNNKTEASIESALDKLCSHLPHSLAGKCLDLVRDYSKEIVEMLLADFEPIEVCVYLKLCTTQNLEPHTEFITDRDGEILTNEIPNTPMDYAEKIKIGGTCFLCKEAMEFVDSKIGTDRNKDKVEDAVHSVCKHLQKVLSASCNKFIDKYGDSIIELLLQNVMPKLVCTALRLCIVPMEAELQVTNLVPETMASEDSLQIGGTCLVCKKAMEFVDSKIGTDRNKGRVEGAVHSVCKHLSKVLSGSCDKFIDKHGDSIIDLLLQNVVPKLVCTALRLCIVPMEAELQVSDVIPDFMASDESIEKDGTCSVCTMTMKFIDKELGTSRARSRIESVVRHVCNRLPYRLSSSCNTFISNHGDMIIDVITHDISPKEVCSLLRFCEEFVVQELKASVTQCDLCNGIITVIDELLGNQKVDDFIEMIVSKVCKHVPANRESKCQAMINVYGQSIINLFTQSLKSNKICGKIGLCATTDYSTVSLEVSRIKRSYEKNRIKHCTWGPLYWCSTNETALECKAVEHCKEKMWKADFAPP